MFMIIFCPTGTPFPGARKIKQSGWKSTGYTEDSEITNKLVRQTELLLVLLFHQWIHSSVGTGILHMNTVSGERAFFISSLSHWNSLPARNSPHHHWSAVSQKELKTYYFDLRLN